MGSHAGKKRRDHLKALRCVLRGIRKDLDATKHILRSTKDELRHATSSNQNNAEYTKKLERDHVIQNLRTSRMISQFVEHLKTRGDPQSLSALSGIDLDARNYNPLNPDPHETNRPNLQVLPSSSLSGRG